jgi:hypothetical protein
MPNLPILSYRTHRGVVRYNAQIKSSIPGSTAADTSELRAELARGTALLLAVVIPVATGRAVGAVATARADLCRARRADSLLVCRRDNLVGEVKPGKRTQATKYNMVGCGKDGRNNQ